MISIAVSKLTQVSYVITEAVVKQLTQKLFSRRFVLFRKDIITLNILFDHDSTAITYVKISHKFRINIFLNPNSTSLTKKMFECYPTKTIL